MTEPDNLPSPPDVFGERPFVQITKLDVSCFPLDDENHGHFSIYVEYRGRDLWAVTDGFRRRLNTDNEWDYEIRPSEREDDWLAVHRFPMNEAIRRAREIAPKLVVNNWTVEDLLLGRDHPTGGRGER